MAAKKSLLEPMEGKSVIDPAVAVIRVKLEAALLRDPSNHRLLEDAAKLITRHSMKERKLDEFDRRQFRALVLSVIEASVAKQNETNRAQKAKQDEANVFALKAQRGTNRAYFNICF